MKMIFVFILLSLLVMSCSDDTSSPIQDYSSSALPHTKWAMNEGNPIFNTEANAWDGGMVSSPMVIMFKDTLRMWYEGGWYPGYSGSVNIGYAWSLDGVVWERNPDNPVLSAAEGSWDYPHLVSPAIIIDGDTLRMWYGGGDITSAGMRIGYAVSVDGVKWTRYPNPVMMADKSWDKDGVIPGGVIKENGVFKLWFSGGIDPAAYPTAQSRWSIGLASSTDGINWMVNDEPVLKYGSNNGFREDLVLCGTVRKMSDGYEMWYSRSHKNGSSSNSQIAYATSSDGINWEEYERNPVLSVSSATFIFGDALYNPCVLVDGTQYMMWFSAWHPGPTIGYATSSNEM